MKYIRGFLMAWGMFCWIPCPYKEWRQEDRTAQLAMLPFLGTCLAAICCLLWALMEWFMVPGMLEAALLTGIYFLLTGFIHLDGFMDCSDAVLPRHPEMSERRRILKDSHVGAFGVICLLFMVLIFMSGWRAVLWQFNLAACGAFATVFTLSRMTAVLMVMLSEPMDVSQYCKLTVGGDAEAGAGGNRNSDNIAEITIAILTSVAVMVITMILARENDFFCWMFAGPLVVAVIAAVVVISGLLVGTFDKQKLGGMNGDIAGHIITTSEMCGLIAIGILV